MYYGQFELDRVIHEKFFKNKENGFFVECGAFDGHQESTCKFFEESLNWKGLNIEPVPFAFDLLIKNRPLSLNENCALSSRNERKTFTNAIHPSMGKRFGNGSLNHSNEHKRELDSAGCTYETFEVNCVKFSELYKKLKLTNIDLFVLDVEGHELEALKGILEIPQEGLPKIFCIETSISGFDKITTMLKDNYDFHSNSHHNSFYIKR